MEYDLDLTWLVLTFCTSKKKLINVNQSKFLFFNEPTENVADFLGVFEIIDGRDRRSRHLSLCSFFEGSQRLGRMLRMLLD